MDKCLKCGGAEFDDGRVVAATHKLFFHSNTIKGFITPSFNTSAKTCLSCGYVEIYCDVERLRSELGE